MLAYLLVFQFVANTLGAKAGAPIEFNDILKTYDRRVRPFINNGSASVTVQLSIVAIGPVKEKDFTFYIDFFMRQWWKDERFNFSEGDVTFNGNPKHLIWLPDLFIRNSLKVHLHSSVTETIRTTVNKDGNIYNSARISALCSCRMDMHRYPMDNQTCSMVFESYAYNGMDLQVKWHNIPVEYDLKEMQIGGYELNGISASEDKVVYVTGEAFPLLKMNLHISRTTLYYIFRTYVPSMLLVMMTWGTFWLPITTYPARVGLVVTNLLAMSFILQGASSQYTKVPYMTAVELFLLINSIFIFAIMVQYILVISIPSSPSKKKSMKKDLKMHALKINEDEMTNAVQDDNNHNSNNKNYNSDSNSNKYKRPVLSSHIIDRKSRVIFPIFYGLFLIIYFIISLK